MNAYKSRFETLGLGAGGSSASSKSLQSNAQAVANKAAALGEAMGQQRVPMVADAAKTMERMMDKFVNGQLDKYAVAAAERQNKQFEKTDKSKTKHDKKCKRKHKEKDKEKHKHKKKYNSKKTKTEVRLIFFVLVVFIYLNSFLLQMQASRSHEALCDRACFRMLGQQF